MNEVSSRELTEWIAYYSINPFGEDRADIRAGIISSTIANVNRSKNQRPYKPSDFIPKFNTESNKQNWQKQLAIVELMNLGYGGKANRSKKA